MRAYVALALLTCGATALSFMVSACSDDDGAAGSDGGAVDGTVVAMHDAGAIPGDATLPTEGGVTAAQACTDLAHARCQALDSCSNFTQTIIRWGSVPECETRIAAQCLLDLAATGTGATPTTTETCAQSLATDDCGDILGDTTPEVCAPIAGSLANGSPCFTSAQCQSTFCVLSATALCGTCAENPVENMTCTSNIECGVGMGCSTSSTAGHKCVTFLDAGEPCTPGQTLCGPGFVCTTVPADPDAGIAMSSTCLQQGRTVGAPCAVNNLPFPDCDPSYGLGCVDNGCIVVPPAGGGEPCGTTDAGIVHCVASGLCVDGTCVAAVSDEGAACDTANGPPCLPQARCMTQGGTAGTCISLSNATCGQ